ncbi:hypothetical protein [Fervidibacter sacchari]
MCPNFLAVREHCPPEKPFAIRYLPFAVVFGSAGASPSRFTADGRSVILSGEMHGEVMACGQVVGCGNGGQFDG